MNKFIVSHVCLVALFGVVTPFPRDNGDVLYEPLSVKTFSMPESCKSKGMEFCFDNSDYPLDEVEQLLEDMTTLEVANDDDVGQIGSYSFRQGNSPDEYDCRSQSTNDPIYYIVDEAGNDRVVVQMEGRFQQRYSVMWCDKEGRVATRTQHFLETTVKEYKMSCDNRYMNYDFLVLSLKPDSKGNWSMERARTKTGIPVCCACRYERHNK